MAEDGSTTYREQFADASKAAEYEDVQYGTGTYSEVLWEVEQDQLAALVDEMRTTRDRIEYLDFACGSGRIISFMEDRVDTATGIEISESMAAIAGAKVSSARLICTDITAADAEIETDGQYDLITSFRFFLNAEPALRVKAMKALVARLRDDTSLLVFNNHGNMLSHKLLMWPLHQLRRAGRGYISEGNYMTDGEARRLAESAGLRIERVIGCGVLSAKASNRMSFDKAVRMEKRLARKWVRRLGVNQMYVCRRKG